METVKMLSNNLKGEPFLVALLYENLESGRRNAKISGNISVTTSQNIDIMFISREKDKCTASQTKCNRYPIITFRM